MQITKKIIEDTEKHVRKIYKKMDLAHNWENHIEYVVKIAVKIAKKEKMDVKAVHMAALLHDIARNKSKNWHAQEGAKMTKKYLDKLKINEKQKEIIIDAVKNHSWGAIYRAKHKEALAVFDADKIDLLGPRGFVRVVIWRTRYKDPKENVDSMIRRVKENEKTRGNGMQTKTGKKIASELLKKSKIFYQSYNLQK